MQRNGVQRNCKNVSKSKDRITLLIFKNTIYNNKVCWSHYKQDESKNLNNIKYVSSSSELKYSKNIVNSIGGYRY